MVMVSFSPVARINANQARDERRLDFLFFHEGESSSHNQAVSQYSEIQRIHSLISLRASVFAFLRLSSDVHLERGTMETMVWVNNAHIDNNGPGRNDEGN